MAAFVDDDSNFDPVAYINTPRWQTSRLGLERTETLLSLLGSPQQSLKFVHVAGTNGKGSTCAYVASILQAAGFRVGLFTSPYIERFEERIRVNGENISAEALRAVTLRVRDCAETMAAKDAANHPTEFELMTAVAFTHFANEGCDIVVCEVGLGGRLDSTNVIEAPEVAVIARIGLDHTAILGDTLAAIAGEKAGIIKKGSCVVSYPQEPEALRVVEAAATAAGCPLMVPDFSQLEIGKVTCSSGAGEVPMRQFSFGSFGSLETRLLGAYQPQNAALALTAVAALRALGWGISQEAVVAGVAAAEWPGRFEVLPRHHAGDPTIVIDGGHNPQGAVALVQSLQDVFPGRKPVFVMGVMADKNYRAMLQTVLPLAEALIAVQPSNPRALEPCALVEAAREIDAGVQAEVAHDYEEAVELARGAVARSAATCSASDTGLICAFGSLYAIADIKEALRGAGLL